MTTGIATRGVRTWTALTAGMLVALGVPLGAQQTASQGAPTPPPVAPGKMVMTPQTSPTTPAGASLDLTMDQAVQMAIDANLGLKQQRLNVDIAAEGVAGAGAVFKPSLSASAATSNSTRLPSSFTDLTAGSISSATSSGAASVSQLLPWLGGSYTASWNSNRSTTTQAAPVFNPQLAANVSFTYTQPLWRGLRTDASRTALNNSVTSKQVADLDIQLQTLELTASVQQAYLGLKAAIAELDVADKNLASAQKNLDETKAEVAVGVDAPADVTSFDVLAQQDRASVLAAQGQLILAQDQLRTMVLDPTRPDYWTVQFNPTDSINVEHLNINIDDAVKTALANRIDVLEARRNLEIAHRTTRLNEDLTHPSVNAQAQYSATSSGGTQFTYGTTAAGTLDTTPLNSTVRSFGSVLDQTFVGDYPSWAVGVTVGYPIGRSVAEANLAQQQLVEKQQQLSLQNLELSVAATVRQAARNVETQYQIMQVTKAALKAAEDQLTAENRRKDLGLSNSFLLTQKEQIETQAAVSEILAQVSYASAVLTYNQVLRVR